MKNLYLLDIDGVLADYAGAFCKYHNWLLQFDKKSFKKMEPKDLPKIPFNDGLKYNQKLYDSIKYLFRRSGGEALSPKPIEGATEFIRWAKSKGHKIYIWTSRPVEEFPNLRRQTIQWLKDNQIKYDKIIFVSNGFDKEFEIISSGDLLGKVGIYNIIAVDDRQLSKEMLKYINEIYIFNQPYNIILKGRRIKNLKELIK